MSNLSRNIIVWVFDICITINYYNIVLQFNKKSITSYKTQSIHQVFNIKSNMLHILFQFLFYT